MFKSRIDSPIKELRPEEFPELLSEIPDPPKKLFLQGSLPDKENRLLCVVGSRKYTNYGKEACESLISGLRGYDIAIISGLALGIDAIAHKSALDAGLKTIAVPGSGLNPKVLYPSTNRSLAGEIVENGGGLLSEFEPEMRATTWTFPQRNRIMAGMSHAVLVIEAEERSGTLITSRLATEYNRDVLTVPGSIFSPNSEGPNMLLRLGATPVRESGDILEALGFETGENSETQIDYSDCSEEEKKLIEILREPMARDDLIRKSDMSPSQANALLSVMEIKGIVKESMGEIRLI